MDKHELFKHAGEDCWHLDKERCAWVYDVLYPYRCREDVDGNGQVCTGQEGHDGEHTNLEPPGTPCHYCGGTIPEGRHGYVSCPRCWTDCQPGDLAELYLEAWSQ